MEATLALEDGRVFRGRSFGAPVRRAGEVVFTGAQQVGVYQFTAGDREYRYALDLRDADESNLQPQDELKIGSRQVQAGVGRPRVERHLWPYLALLALAVLLFEWHLYHRRY